MKKPVPPDPEDCCNSGCNPCILDVYERKLKEYEKSLLTDADESKSFENALCELSYTKFTTIASHKISDSYKYIGFKCEDPERKKHKVMWDPGQYFLLKFDEDDKSFTRAYTPIKKNFVNLTANTDSDFVILLKKYDNGLVSKYLYLQETGKETFWRGPYGSYKIFPSKYRRILMIAQGTGIAPFISIINEIVNNDDDMSKITLYYCCRNINSAVYRDELYSLKSFWNFDYIIFTSQKSEGNIIKYQEPIKPRKFSIEDLKQFQPNAGDDQFLICGSTSFMDGVKKNVKELCKELNEKNIVTF